MKKMLTFLAVLFVYSNSFAVVSVVAEQHQLQSSFENLDPMFQQMDMDDFLVMTPKKYREMTGKKMGVKKTLQLKLAQRVLKKATAKNANLNADGTASMDIPQIVYILAAIFGLAWLVMGLVDNWSGNNWWVNLIFFAAIIVLTATIIGILLTPLAWLGGLIHALIKMKDYY